MARAVALFVAATAVVAASRPVRTILDTDIATDFDDTWALHLILSRPDVYDLQLVQVSTFNTTKRAQVTAAILAGLGRFDIPISVGTNTGEQGMPQYDAAAAAFSLDNDWVAHGGVLLAGSARMGELMASSTPADPVLVIEIAPATSLGEVLAANPSVSRNCLCVAMSGSIYHGYRNSSSPSVEYNVHTDILASQRVYNATWLAPMVTAPLDTTVFAQFFGSPYALLQQAAASQTPNGPAHPLAASLYGQYLRWWAGGGSGYSALVPFSPSNGTDTLYDVQAAFMAGAYAGWYAGNGTSAGGVPSFPFFTAPLLPIAVQGNGATVITPGAQPVAAAVGFPRSAAADMTDVALAIVSSIVAAS